MSPARQTGFTGARDARGIVDTAQQATDASPTCGLRGAGRRRHRRRDRGQCPGHCARVPLSHRLGTRLRTSLENVASVSPPHLRVSPGVRRASRYQQSARSHRFATRRRQRSQCRRDSRVPALSCRTPGRCRWSLDHLETRAPFVLGFASCLTTGS